MNRICSIGLEPNKKKNGTRATSRNAGVSCPHLSFILKDEKNFFGIVKSSMLDRVIRISFFLVPGTMFFLPLRPSLSMMFGIGFSHTNKHFNDARESTIYCILVWENPSDHHQTIG